jgi:16S rRNA (adenine1518-N6/adenine1519-N6)-dimethyltransferase
MKTARGPLKSLGQNFLVDRNIVDKIIRSAALGPGDAVLEIGPGRGALTPYLVREAGQVLLIEFDHALAAEHSQCYGTNSAVTVVDGDVLAVDLPALLAARGGWKVIANLPYNISTQVLFRLLEVRAHLSLMVLMLQKEVGDRLVARPGCGEYGVTTVLLGLWFDIEREFIVPPGCFHPRPKVDSAVMKFVPLAAPRVEVGDEALFRRVVKAAFAMRRKTLANCLKHADLPCPEGVGMLLESCGIDGQRRGETLSLEEFARLSRHLSGA